MHRDLRSTAQRRTVSLPTPSCLAPRTRRSATRTRRDSNNRNARSRTSGSIFFGMTSSFLTQKDGTKPGVIQTAVVGRDVTYQPVTAHDLHTMATASPKTSRPTRQASPHSLASPQASPKAFSTPRNAGPRFVLCEIPTSRSAVSHVEIRGSDQILSRTIARDRGGTAGRVTRWPGVRCPMRDARA